MQFLIHPEVTEHAHIAVFGILAGGRRVSDAGLHRAVRVKPAVRFCLGQQTLAYGEDRPGREEATDEEVPVAIQPNTQRGAVVQQAGRVKKVGIDFASLAPSPSMHEIELCGSAIRHAIDRGQR
jgi:hypothetical protein